VFMRMQTGQERSRLGRALLVITVNGRCVLWGSKLQAIMATSTTEAEHIAGGMAVKEALWVRKLLGDITGRDPSMDLYCGNRSTMKIMTQHTARERGRTKHIDIQYHFIKERFHRGGIDIKCVESSQQLADVFTKVLPGPAFQKAIMNLMGTGESRDDSD
jgi:hypothetical protein